MSLILELKNLHVRYGKVEALHGCNLKVEAGQIVTVIGPNGAGKSTMLNAIMGALPTTGSVSGDIHYLGQDVGDLKHGGAGRARHVPVPESRELFSSMSIEDNLQLGAFRRKKAGDSNYMDQLPTVFELFPRLLERRKQAAGTLSGGERQMLAVGRALMAKPQLLMLDEPSLGLAPLITKEIFRTISSCAKPASPRC